MVEIETKREHRSMHQDYLLFAWHSLLDCSGDKVNPITSAYVNRPAIEAIRYSYDCLDASINFVLEQGKLNQLPITIRDNWLSRFLDRKWIELSLSDRIGILSFAWTMEPFWKTDDQFQLYEDLRKVRNGLTHPKPFGREVTSEVLREQSENECKISRQIGEDRLLKPDWLVAPNKAIASFNQRPDKLGKEDAEIAFEILLHHLSRFEELFFNNRTTWFGVYDKASKQGLYPKNLLNAMNCRFKQIWETGSSKNL